MEVVCLIVQIHKYKGKQELYVMQKPIILDNLVEISKIQNTQAFNEIKGGRSALYKKISKGVRVYSFAYRKYLSK